MIRDYSPRINIFIIALCCLTISGCQLAKPPSSANELSWQNHQQKIAKLQKWTLKGKLSIRTPTENETPYLHWEQNEQRYAVRLFGALGFGATYINGDNNTVNLQRSGEPTLSANSPEDLVQQELQMDIPVSHLLHWIKGIPVPAATYQKMRLNENQRLQYFEQDNWQVEITRYQFQQGYWLPKKVTLRKNQLKILLVIKSWSLPTS